VGERRAHLGRIVTERVAFVTGGSRGIGRATCVALAAAGHRVAFCYGSDDAGAADTEAAVRSTGGEVLAIRASVGDTVAIDAAFSMVEDSFGPVELLVNNAGITRDGLLARMTDEAWDDVIRVNLTGAFQAIRRATPKMMRARFGRIINVSSIGGHLGGAGQANYSAAKAGLLGLSRSVAREYGSRGITCNVVAPGPIVTAMTEAQGEEWMAGVATAVPVGRFGTPEECAATIAFLCSDAAGYITGALVPVDGGLGMGH
jgi:NAD(P)-dependent dehydrogenase (short-subunit alcohol dehydrogenase family)